MPRSIVQILVFIDKLSLALLSFSFAHEPTSHLQFISQNY